MGQGDCRGLMMRAARGVIDADALRHKIIRDGRCWRTIISLCRFNLRRFSRRRCYALAFHRAMGIHEPPRLLQRLSTRRRHVGSAVAEAPTHFS